MAEIQNPEEPTFHTKRKPDLNSEDIEEQPKKGPKLGTSDNNCPAPCDRSEECEATPESNINSEAPTSNCASVAEEKTEKVESDAVAKQDGIEGDNEVDSDDEDNEGDEDEDEDEDDDDDDDDDDEDDEESNGKAEVDPKGKGILRDDKGKGKMIEEDDDDDDSSDDEGAGDSDLSDDPLAEVDLNNILPSRTRRKPTHPGVFISNDLGNDEGDDSDA